MEVIFHFFNLLVFPLEEGFLLLFILVEVHYCSWVAGYVLEVDVHFVYQFKFTTIFYVVHVQPITYTVVDTSENDDSKEY